MLFLASFILKGPSQAALVAASMAILGLAVPPAAWISAAAIVLVTLVNGPKSGLLTTAFSAFGAGIFAFLIFSSPQVALVFVLLAWLPAWIIATVLRQTVSLAYSLQVLTAISLLAVVMVYAIAPNIGEHWREPLNIIVTQLAEQSEDFTLAELQKTEDWVIKFLPGLFVSSVMFGTVLSLFLGRWWQAVFYNPGGFGEEFRNLNLGKISALCASAIMLIAMFIGNVFALAMVAVVFALYGIQALSLLHAAIKIRQVNAAWLFAIYAIMFFVPHVLLLLILVSFADPWLDIRQRISQQV
ncbi:FIG003573: hypothetical protein [hydrothermal vent metagenome]|uniref:DUF2232 domain-containing protein n=1 Tax=hydrothermal vent metagenome TaxID=652676 RepID=A0A3B0WM82_9ZZZZ